MVSIQKDTAADPFKMSNKNAYACMAKMRISVLSLYKVISNAGS